MAKHTPDNPERRVPDADTANPHRAEPAPPPEEGLRPEADAAVVRPESDEPLGPAQGLFHDAAVEAAHGAPFATPRADAEAQHLGVEEEGIESSQIFGLILATVVAIACLILVLYFVFYLPKLSQTERAAQEVPADRRVEQREERAAAENLLQQYAVNPDAEGRYRIPIDVAMQEVVADYAGRTGLAPSPYADRADYNLSWAVLEPAPAVASAADSSAIQAPVAPVEPDSGATPPAAPAPQPSAAPIQ